MATQNSSSTHQIAVQEPNRRLRAWHQINTRQALALLVVLALATTTVLTLFGFLSTPPDRYYTGVVLNIPDHNQYFAWMRDLASAPLAPNRLTSEPNDPAFFNLLWWSIGRFGAVTGIELPILISLLRIVAVCSLLGAAYLFLQIAMDHPPQRLLAFTIFTFAGGIGVIWTVLKYVAPWIATDGTHFMIFTAEPNSFLIMLAFPHFGIALALLVAMIGLTLYAQQRQQLRYAFAAGLVGALIGLQHAYDLLTIYTVLGLWGLLIWWRDRRFPLFLGKAALIIAACTIPPAAYLSYLVLTDATWGGKLAQFDNAGAWTPGPLHLPILMGVPLFLALLAFRPRMLRSRNDAEILVAAWFLAHFGLIYLPVKFQIHLLLGWQMPIAILGALALTTMVGPWLRNRVPRLATPALIGILGLCFVTNAYIFAWRFIDLGRHEQPYYLSQDEAAALEWLAEHTTRADVVLGTLEINQHVPVWSDARAFLAHWAGTLDYYRKVELARIALDPTTPAADRQAVFDEFNVTYLIVREIDSPRSALATAAPMMTPVFVSGEVSVFAVSGTADP